MTRMEGRRTSHEGPGRAGRGTAWRPSHGFDRAVNGAGTESVQRREGHETEGPNDGVVKRGAPTACAAALRYCLLHLRY